MLFTVRSLESVFSKCASGFLQRFLWQRTVQVPSGSCDGAFEAGLLQPFMLVATQASREQAVGVRKLKSALLKSASRQGWNVSTRLYQRCTCPCRESKYTTVCSGNKTIMEQSIIIQPEDTQHCYPCVRWRTTILQKTITFAFCFTLMLCFWKYFLLSGWCMS